MISSRVKVQIDIETQSKIQNIGLIVILLKLNHYHDINATAKFMIKSNKDNIMKVSKDGRPWDKWMNSSRTEIYLASGV